MPTLILPPRTTPDTDAILEAAQAAGWEALRLDSWRVPTGLDRDDVALYGEPLFADVVAPSLGVALLQAPFDWLTGLPERYRRREVMFPTLATARAHLRPTFIKPADDNCFAARVYASGAELPADRNHRDLPGRGGWRLMEAAIFVGIQASGKSSFYRERFFTTHVRISLDLLRTRRRERSVLAWCLDHQQPFVVDNTNPTIAERAVYIAPAKAAGFRVIGYIFESDVPCSIRRNEGRSGAARVPPAAIGGTKRRLEPPTLVEGFDVLHFVRIGDDGRFVVEA